MLLRIALKIPLLQCIVYFPFASHKKAARKFAVLLIATSLPILVAAALAEIPVGDENVFVKLWAKVADAVNISELFVYATSFLAPYLYLIYERYMASRRKAFGAAFDAKEKIDLFPGYFLVLGLASILIIATAITFGLMKAQSVGFSKSFLHLWLSNYAFWVYVFGLYCWYLTLLDEVHDPAVYSSELGNGSADLEQQLAARLKERN